MTRGSATKFTNIEKMLKSWVKVSPIDILVYLSEQKGRKATWSDFEKYFVKGDKENHVSTQTLSNYLKTLLRAGVLAKEIDKETFQPVYVLEKSDEIEYPVFFRKLEKSLVKNLSEFISQKSYLSVLTRAAAIAAAHKTPLPEKSWEKKGTVELLQHWINEYTKTLARLNDGIKEIAQNTSSLLRKLVDLYRTAKLLSDQEALMLIDKIMEAEQKLRAS